MLVHAGAGGLGSTVIQVAKHLGAHVATTAHTNDLDQVRALGADKIIDFTQQDFVDVLSGYDVVLDSLGSASVEKSLMVLKPGGLATGFAGQCMCPTHFYEIWERRNTEPAPALRKRRVGGPVDFASVRIQSATRAARSVDFRSLRCPTQALSCVHGPGWDLAPDVDLP